YASEPAAGAPWALYAASNLGSFGGLIAYPLLVEPALGLDAQGWLWALGYGLLIVLVALSALARWQTLDNMAALAPSVRAVEPVVPRRIVLWLMLSAVPSGLMLSTTTHLTTDLFAMPLLWVIPLGLYLLSFVPAFSDRRGPARTIALLAPPMMLLAGGMAMVSRHSSSLVVVLLAVALLFVVCVALHARLYDARPDPAQLTLFYFVMSAGGALGGLFTALIAPLLFDWVWEHPLLVIAAAMLLPAVPWLDWRRLPGLEPGMARLAAGILVVLALVLCWFVVAAGNGAADTRLWLIAGVVVLGVLLAPWRALFVTVLVVLMLAQGGMQTIRDTIDGLRTRSYFGIYTVRDYPAAKLRILAHGTTLHGEQSFDPHQRNVPVAYYGASSGAGLAIARAPLLYGGDARIGVVGLGAGTLACYRQPDQAWTFFEIDPAVLEFSRNRTFTYIGDCAPDARMLLGDARLELARLPRASFDILVIDAFSSDAIPLHLLTDEAFGVYLNALAPDGLLAVHISNRFIDLEPVLAALAHKRGLKAVIRDDAPQGNVLLTASSWVLLSRDPARLAALEAATPGASFRALRPPAPRAWTDDHASILPYIRWNNMLGKAKP
ncbi:MAG: fused MFS/spermidine synthase, partial [Novosphingobium sp.]